MSLYSEGVMDNDRIAAFLNAASGDILTLSEGSIYGFCKKMAQHSTASILKLEETLLNQSTVATDATTVTVNGKQNYIRNFSTKDTVVYYAMNSKLIKALEKIELLKKYSGFLLHDHEAALYHFGTDHAECNVHIIRYLRKNTEEIGNKWSNDMISLLNDMNKARKKLMAQGVSSFSEEDLKKYEENYRSIIKKGRSENNISERDLRKTKNRQKMTEGFRKESGNEMYCSILTIVETLKRRNMGMIENIKKLFMGTPAIF